MNEHGRHYPDCGCYKAEYEREIKELKKEIKKIKEVNNSKYFKWAEDYEKKKGKCTKSKKKDQ